MDNKQNKCLFDILDMISIGSMQTRKANLILGV